jgi:GNAT superfamily N-acetyltransferase
VIVRPARPDERELIARIHRAAAERAYAGIFPSDQPFPWQETLARWRNFAGEIRVAACDDAADPVGFVAFDLRELYALYVQAEYWSRGIGGSLLETAGGVSELWVLSANVRARRFYERRGWQEDGTSRQAYGVTELRYRRPAALL